MVRFVNEWRNTDGTNYALNHQAFDSIRFVAVDGSGNVYTGDTWGCPAYASQCTSTNPVQDPGYRVLKFSPNDWTAKPSCNPSNATAQTTCAGATPSATWSAGTEPPPQGGFNQQNGIAVVPNDSEATGGADGLYVVDTFEQRVQKFDTNQTCASAGSCPGWIRQWGGRAPSNPDNEGFGYPRALTYEPDGHHDIWVGDNNNDVMAFTQQGGFVHRFGSQGKSPGMFSGGVQGIRVQGGRVYATDVAGCRLQVFDEAQLLSVPSGTSALEDVVGGCGNAPAQMSAPRGIAVDPTNPSIVYVANTGNGVITKWQLNLGAPGSFNGGGTATQIKPSCDGKTLAQPWGITYEDGWYYIGDVKNDRVVRWQPGTGAGTCQTVVQGLTSTDPGFYQPGMIGSNFVEFGADPSPGVHRMYISDNSRHITFANKVESWNGSTLNWSTTTAGGIAFKRPLRRGGRKRHRLRGRLGQQAHRRAERQHRRLHRHRRHQLPALAAGRGDRSHQRQHLGVGHQLQQAGRVPRRRRRPDPDGERAQRRLQPPGAPRRARGRLGHRLPVRG